MKVAPSLKIVYIVRDPVRRALSHHKHMVNWSGEGRMPQDVNVAIENHPELMSYSCYAMQLQPWIKAFGLENILVIKFEDYVSDRTVVTNRVCRFLSLPETELELSEAGANRGESRRYAGKFVYNLYRSKFFRNVVQPAAPDFLRKALRQVLLRKNRQVEIPPTRATLEQIADGVKTDGEKLQVLLKLNEPLWNVEQTIEKVLLKEKGN